MWLLALMQVYPALPPVIIDEPNLEIVIRREFYGVTGRRYRDAHNAAFTFQLSSGGVAMVRPDIQFQYSYEESDEGCRLTDYYVFSHVNITYPVWVEYEDRGRRDRERWDELFERLQIHENRHSDIAIQSAARWRNYLAMMDPEPTCEQLEAVIRAEFDREADWHERNQSEYDRITQHGQQQSEADDWVPHDDARD